MPKLFTNWLQGHIINDEKCDLFQGEAKFLTGGIVREPAFAETGGAADQV